LAAQAAASQPKRRRRLAVCATGWRLQIPVVAVVSTLCGLAGRFGESKTIGSVRNVPPFKQQQCENVLAEAPGVTGAVSFVLFFAPLAERKKKL
jgi:hypothetical protein